MRQPSTGTLPPSGLATRHLSGTWPGYGFVMLMVLLLCIKYAFVQVHRFCAITCGLVLILGVSSVIRFFVIVSHMCLSKKSAFIIEI